MVRCATTIAFAVVAATLVSTPAARADEPEAVETDDARAAAIPPSPRDLSGGAFLIAGGYVPGRQPDGNTVVFDAPQGLVVIDTGRHAGHARRIVAWAEAARKPVAAIVNSHWHLDHVSGNPALRAIWPDVAVYGSLAIDDALTGFLADYRVQLLEAMSTTRDPAQLARWRDEVARIDSGPRLRPTVPVDAAGERVIAGRRLYIGTAQAATRGDLWVFDPQSRVLAAGDLVTLPAPFLDTACPVRWRDGFGVLAAQDFLRLVPGHGEPMDREGFNTYRRAFNNLLACAATPTSTRTCVAGWRRDAAPLLSDADRAVVDGMIAYYVQYRLRGPGPTADCGTTPHDAPSSTL